MSAALLRLPMARLTRSPRGWIAVGGWALLALVSAFAASARPGHHAVDQVLLGVFGDVALPLLAFGVVSAALAGKNLAAAAAPLVGFGAPPARAALAHVAVAAVASAAAGALLAALVVLVARDAGAPPLGYDLVASAYAGLLGGAAYGALFALGSAFGPRGAGRTFALVFDWMLGSSAGTGAMLVPRGHVRSLLGDASRVEVSARGSAVALVVLVVVFAAIAVFRASRAPRAGAVS